MRGAKLEAPPELTTKADLNRVVQTREYRLITPLFGGGVRPGEADPVTTVRGATVRGQLRFWWRAARGGHYRGDLAAMKAAEALLWGAASAADGGGPSLVEVAVVQLRGSRPFTAVDRRGSAQGRDGQPINIGHPTSADSYAAFPLADKPGSVVLENVAFRLTLAHPARWPAPRVGPAQFAGTPAEEVAAALWAWETFGGVGARTRRGFGALQCVQVDGAPPAGAPAGDAAALAAWLRSGLAAHVVDGAWPPDVPHLARDMELRVVELPGGRDPLSQWRQLIDRLKAFRQQRPLNRLVENGRPITRPGRNHWPEQDEVRRITRRRSPRHRGVVSAVRKFPRAAFGLPLIIQYKRDDQRDGDPGGNNTVVGLVREHGREVKVDRLASPLILRPLAGAGGAAGLAALLRGSRLPDQLVLEHRGGRDPVEWRLTPEEAAAITTPDGRPLLGAETDVLLAFLNTL
jgi:CRISPR-associated protein Cmr1